MTVLRIAAPPDDAARLEVTVRGPHRSVAITTGPVPHRQPPEGARAQRLARALPMVALLIDHAAGPGAFTRICAEYGLDTWVCGYADDMISYIPSRRVWLEGGYEGGPNLFEYGRPALRWAGDIETRVNKTVTKLVKAVEK